MNILAVDDEQASLSLLRKALIKVLPEESPRFFLTAEEALSYARKVPIDVAFVDIEMGSDMNGLEFAGQLAAIKADTNIIFVTGYMQYMDAAFEMYASGYVKKPVRVARMKQELEHLRYPVKEKEQITGAYTFDYTARRVYRNGEDILLTSREYSIFYILASSPGVFFTARDLYEKTSRLDAKDELRALYVHISNLRKKLGLDGGGNEKTIDIEHNRGKGYRLIITAEAEP